ncbi:patatin-like phospholipase family protein [Nocardia fusca]|uniref:patatin-like phospholipase family protein n=1 Tax=Nocardia fusca TaxID=941183 RepID=UPI00378C8483
MATAFVLWGGSSLGAAQVGMLRALTARGVHADMVVGAWVGALNGSFYAARPMPMESRPLLGCGSR